MIFSASGNHCTLNPLHTIGLFVVLALVMFMTRKIDWYGMHTPKKELPMGATNEGGRA